MCENDEIDHNRYFYYVKDPGPILADIKSDVLKQRELEGEMCED